MGLCWAAGSETCSEGRRLEWHLGVRCLGTPWWREAGSLSFNLTPVSCGMGKWSVPPSRTKVAASITPAVLYLQVSTSELDGNVWKTGPFSSGSLRPLGAAQPAPLKLLRASFPPCQIVSRAYIYYFNCLRRLHPPLCASAHLAFHFSWLAFQLHPFS